MSYDINDTTCKEWIKNQFMHCMSDPKASAVPITGSSLILLGIANFFLPTIKTMAVNFAVRKAVEHLNPLKMVDTLFSSMKQTLQPDLMDKQKKQQIDDAIDTYSSHGDGLKRISESKINIMIVVISILLFYFQYVGMNTMRVEKKKYTSILQRSNKNEDDILNQPTPNSFVKKKIFEVYNKSTYYQNNSSEEYEFDKWMDPREYLVVRGIYNTLVGLNSTLFYCLGGHSDDPTHEIVHWTKVLMYWEILARLIHRNGLGPMTMATNLLLSNLGKRKKKREN